MRSNVEGDGRGVMGGCDGRGDGGVMGVVILTDGLWEG